MRWKYLFESAILTRGRDYYRLGRVFRVTKKDSEYAGVVRGTENYAVTAKFLPSGALSSLGCSCPHAREGNFCKHMAALLFAVEAGEYQTAAEVSAQDHSIWKDAAVPETEIARIEKDYADTYTIFSSKTISLYDLLSIFASRTI